MKNLRTIVVVCSFFLTGHIYAQSPNSNCLDLVKSYYRKLNNPADPVSNNNVYYLNYSVQTHMRDSISQPNTKSDVELYLSNKKVRFTSKEIQVYQDEQNAFTIIPGRKVIYRNDPTLNLEREMRTKKLSLLQDTLLGMSEVLSCKDVVPGMGRYDKEVVLQLSKKAQELFQVERLVFYLDTRQQVLRKVNIYYTSAKEIASLEVTFNVIDYNNKSNKLSQAVAPMFVDSKEQLLPVYKGFDLVDVRGKR